MSAPTPSTQVFVASTAFGLATVAAAIDDGRYPSGARRILITSNNAAIPEVAPEITDVAGVRALLDRFDAVFSYNELVAPQHPGSWRPRANDLPIWRRHLELVWGIDGGDLQLVVESIQVPPALVLVEAFPDARIDVYGDGLMSYGPTRIALPATVAARIERLLHLDLVPGVQPLLLSEFDITTELIGTEAFSRIIAEIGDHAQAVTDVGARDQAVLVGQYLSSAGLITSEQEDDLHKEMIKAAVRAGFRELIFKPHPAAPTVTAALTECAASVGARLQVRSEPALVETWFDRGHVGLVVGCFSTALFTAGSLYSLPTVTVGTELVLRHLKPYENSNRIPAVLADAGTADPVLLNQLVQAVGYCMQPERYPDSRGAAEQLLTRRPEQARRYITKRVINELELPGRARPRSPLKQAVLKTVGTRRYRQLASAWAGILR